MSKPLPTATPESQGLDSRACTLLAAEFEKRGFETHSLRIVKNNFVVYEAGWAPYTVDSWQHFFSVSKSFLASAFGFAVAEDRLTVDDLVLNYFPDVAPAEPSENLKALKIRDLLTMSGGHEKEIELSYATPSAEYARQFLAHPFVFKPGTHFFYNTPGSNLLSILLQRVTGETLSEYLTPRLIEPLDSPPIRWSQYADWVLGGTGIHSSVDLITRFSIMYLNEGEFYGKRILDSAWVREATAKQVENGVNNDEWSYGYGYQFWRGGHNTYRCDGAFVQLGIAIPEHNTVVALTSGDSPLDKLLECVWEVLLPALEGKAVVGDDKPRLDLISEDIVSCHQTGAWGGADISFSAKGDEVTLKDPEHQLTCRYDGWTTTDDGKWATRASWPQPGHLVVKRCNMTNGSWMHWQFDIASHTGKVQEFARFGKLRNDEFALQVLSEA